MILNDYLKKLQIENIKNNHKIKRRGSSEVVDVDTGLGSIDAIVKTKDLDESLIGSEDEVERTLDVASALIMRVDENNRKYILLLQRASDDHWPNVWEFPRGKCDKPIGESLIHCVKREIKEETGLDIYPVRKVDVYEYIADHGRRKTICHVFLCKMKDQNQKVKLSKEHQDYQWVGEGGEVEMMLMPDQKNILLKFLNRERAIVSYPENGKMKTVEEYLQCLNSS